MTFSTSFSVYYDFGSVYSGTLIASTLAQLNKEIERFVKKQKEDSIKIHGCDTVEAITFTPITITKTTTATKGRFYLFKSRDKIKNSYIKNGLSNKNYVRKTL